MLRMWQTTALFQKSQKVANLSHNLKKPKNDERAMRACSAHTKNRRIFGLAGCALQVFSRFSDSKQTDPTGAVRCLGVGARRTRNDFFGSVRVAPIGTVWRRSAALAGLSRAILDDPEKAERGRDLCRPWPLTVDFLKTFP